MKYVLSVAIILIIGTSLFADDISPTRNEDKKIIKIEGGCLGIGAEYYVYGERVMGPEYYFEFDDENHWRTRVAIFQLLASNDKEISDYLKIHRDMDDWAYNSSIFASLFLFGGAILLIKGYGLATLAIGLGLAAATFTFSAIGAYYIYKAVNRSNYIIQHQSMNSLNEPCFIIGRRLF